MFKNDFEAMVSIPSAYPYSLMMFDLNVMIKVVYWGIPIVDY